VAAYGLYLRLWQPGAPAPRADGGVVPANWQGAKRPVLRLAVLMGPSTHVTLIAVAGLLGRPEYYLWTGLVAGTVWGLFVTSVDVWRGRALRAGAA
jgi:hypothetical protein